MVEPCKGTQGEKGKINNMFEFYSERVIGLLLPALPFNIRRLKFHSVNSKDLLLMPGMDLFFFNQMRKRAAHHYIKKEKNLRRLKQTHQGKA